ncbi:PF08643 family protein [Leptospira inadai serovar Lyme str. 10]|uniref:PF08643 family protein n=2 Tax=Leptospira inadai serovar Lyme TaxID=293084 RepID=V6HMJ1_9LEPT|nr:SDR family NAD(P)-dependent oxidoreductase [Leptospira inadai]EQA38115.1 PF08643 family protein [Leptospira inadai serovar Lyme str. 10]PNV74781.1 short-chain dehydrogenase [Leptospira inadai serovar Lyme]
MEYILVTGVNSGVGLALTETLISKNFFVFGSVRSRQQGAALRDRLGDRFHPLYFDVTDETAISAAVQEAEEILGGKGLRAVINNAGVVIPGPLVELPIDSFRRQIEINLIGPFLVVQKFIALLGGKKDSKIPPGRIINISSMSGIRTFPFLAAYSVSKYGLEALTDGLRRELSLYGIDVVSILPGAILTPLTDKINEGILKISDDSEYKDSLLKFVQINEKKAKAGVPMEKVIAAIIDAIQSSNPKVRYFLKSSFLTDTVLSEYLPTRVFDKLISKTLGIHN